MLFLAVELVFNCLDLFVDGVLLLLDVVNELVQLFFEVLRVLELYFNIP